MSKELKTRANDVIENKLLKDAVQSLIDSGKVNGIIRNYDYKLSIDDLDEAEWYFYQDGNVFTLYLFQITRENDIVTLNGFSFDNETSPNTRICRIYNQANISQIDRMSDFINNSAYTQIAPCVKLYKHRFNLSVNASGGGTTYNKTFNIEIISTSKEKFKIESAIANYFLNNNGTIIMITENGSSQYPFRINNFIYTSNYYAIQFWSAGSYYNLLNSNTEISSYGEPTEL